MNNRVQKSVKSMRLNMNELHTGLYFQNEPNKSRINQISSNFDWNKCQALDVSYRDGKYNVLDGQHRLFAIKNVFGNQNKTINVPCLVRFNLTEAEEMELFVALAVERRKVKPLETYKAMYGSGNKPIVEMIDAVKEAGLIFDFKNGKGKNRITAVKTLHKIYDQLGKQDLVLYLKLIKNTWDGDNISLQKDILLGVFEFFKKYRFDYNEKTFIKKLQQYSPSDIRREGKSDLTSKVEIGCAKSILNKYNKGLKEKTRLDNKF